LRNGPDGYPLMQRLGVRFTPLCEPVAHSENVRTLGPRRD
jgi:hypothetical protein